jgi:hypothetical protein
MFGGRVSVNARMDRTAVSHRWFLASRRYGLKFAKRLACAGFGGATKWAENLEKRIISVRTKSGAEVTALQALARRPGISESREASGLRRVDRRCLPSFRQLKSGAEVTAVQTLRDNR